MSDKELFYDECDSLFVAVIDKGKLDDPDRIYKIYVMAEDMATAAQIVDSYIDNDVLMSITLIDEIFLTEKQEQLA